MKKPKAPKEDFAGYQEDPEPADEDDPEYQLEMFETFKAMGTKPEEITDLKYRKKYAAWLAKQ